MAALPVKRLGGSTQRSQRGKAGCCRDLPVCLPTKGSGRRLPFELGPGEALPGATPRRCWLTRLLR